MPRTLRRLAPCSLLLAGAACGDSADTAGFELHFLLSRGDRALECREMSEIKKVQVTVYRADGATTLPAWPKVGDCTSGTMSISGLPVGEVVVEVSAQGELAGELDVVLFRGRRKVSLPEDTTVELALSPEVAFFSVAWSFGTQNELGPCDGEVGRIDLYVSTGAAGKGSYQRLGLDCPATPFAIPTPFFPQRYTVRLEAYAIATARLLYVVQEERLLDRGENPPYLAVFKPAGGLISLDWEFGVRGVPYQACNAAQVGADRIGITVDTRGEAQPFVTEIPCAVPRPYVLPGVRFAQGRDLRLTLLADGVHRFVAKRAFKMPADDHDLGLLRLDAVGSATITFTLSATSSCAGGVDGFHGTLEDPVTGQVALEASIEPNERSTSVEDVPLGEYEVRLTGKRGTATACETHGRRVIEHRENEWAPFEL